MSSIPENLFYTKDHEWVQLLDDGTAVIGITDYAQASLGDVTFVELPEADSEWSVGDTFGVVESVKAASDLYMPLSGTVLEVNEDLVNGPEAVNQEPYGAAWMVKLRISDPAEQEKLLSAADYKDLVG